MRTVKPVTDLSTSSQLQNTATQLAILASIVASSDDSILSENLDGIINSWNPAAERMYGHTVEEAIGQSVSILFGPGFEAEQSDIRGKIRAGQRIKNYETVRIRKDGSTIPISLTISPIHDLTGTVIGASAISRDMTESKQASRYARDILESAPDAMVIIDKVGTVVIVNAQTEKLFGYHRDEILGQSVELLIPSRFHAKHSSLWYGYFTNSEVRPMDDALQLFGRRKDGGEFPVEISLSPIETPNGVLVAGAIRDVTGRLRIRQLEEMNELRNEFVAVVAHDLRSPMTSTNTLPPSYMQK